MVNRASLHLKTLPLSTFPYSVTQDSPQAFFIERNVTATVHPQFSRLHYFVYCFTVGKLSTCFQLQINEHSRRTVHGIKGFVIPTKSFVKIGITKIFCCSNKMFGSINKTFDCCGKIFNCSNKNFICCSQFSCRNKTIFFCVSVSAEIRILEPLKFSGGKL